MLWIIGWLIAAGVELIAWSIKSQLLDRRINALATDLVRRGNDVPTIRQDEQQRLQQWSDRISWALVSMMVVTTALLPPMPSTAIYNAAQSNAFGSVIFALLLLVLELELSPLFYSSLAHMRIRGLASEGIQVAIAIIALVVIITLPLAEEQRVAHPINLYVVRAFLLGNMAFCGGLTLYRELRRRVRSGDILSYGTTDSLRVTLYVLILFNVVAMALTAPVILSLQLTGMLEPTQTIAAGLNLLAFVWTFVSIGYFALYTLRRINRARGFSWIDPPNWRVALPHLRYHFHWFGFFLAFAWLAAAQIVGRWVAGPVLPGDATAGLRQTMLLLAELIVLLLVVVYSFRPAPARGIAWLNPVYWPSALRLAIRQSFTPPLADVVRVTYLRALFGTNDEAELLDLIETHARIAPLNDRQFADSIHFNIIGDPGEGDDSQLYPGSNWQGSARQASSAAQERKTAQSPGQLLNDLIEQPVTTTATIGFNDDPEAIDFAIISSDVIYPGGEMCDYERAFYRPNAPRDRYKNLFTAGRTRKYPFALRDIVNHSPPCYAIPGNHDWYDSLHGFFTNFAYNATLGQQPTDLVRIKQLPWDWRPWRQADRRRAAVLRRRYRLRTAGGLPSQRATHQRLSFFEMTFGAVPLALFALDNGVTGSIDSVQYQWLARRLKALRSAPATEKYYIVVLVGNPLYVNGEFAGSKEATETRAVPRRSYSPRELYELLRRYQVDVVMGGDTHAYERYAVRYADEQGQWHVMHHIVNGGGGAYLTQPMDAGWLDFNRQRKPPLSLSRRSIYHPGVWGHDRALDARADQVVLLDLFPTFNEMMEKFVWNQPSQPPTRPLDRAIAWLRRAYVSSALASGFTNALNHDAPPLLQSYVRVELTSSNAGWKLEFIPYMKLKNDTDPEPILQRYPDTTRWLTLPEPTPVLARIPSANGQPDTPPDSPPQAAPART